MMTTMTGLLQKKFPVAKSKFWADHSVKGDAEQIFLWNFPSYKADFFFFRFTYLHELGQFKVVKI